MGNIDKVNVLNRRLSALSPAKRALLERTLLKSVGDRPIGNRKPAVIQLKEGGDKIPLYFIYAGPDEFRVAQMMGAEHPIFGIEVPWPLSWREAAANNEIAALPTLEQYVAPFVDVLSAHLGSSPCVLAGHSFGGIMVFEAAHQLQRQGAEVKMVVMLDTGAAFLTPHQVVWWRLRDAWRETSKELETDRSSQSISFRLSNLWQISWRVLVKAAKALLRRVFKWSQSFFNPPNFNPPKPLGGLTTYLDEECMPLDWSLINRLYGNAMKSYRFRSLNSKGIAFVAQPENQRRITAFDPILGWENLFTKGLEIVPVPGDHQTIVRHDPHILFLAQKLNEVLERYEAN